MGAERPGQEVGAEFRLSRARRVRRGPEIRELFRRGKRGRTSHLDVFVSASPVSFPRLGVVVPKHRHSIVERNLLRRRLREIGRIEILPRLREAGLHVDVLVRARKEGYDAGYEQLRDELVRYAEGMCSDR
jgi:ribonuclease P protein component